MSVFEQARCQLVRAARFAALALALAAMLALSWGLAAPQRAHAADPSLAAGASSQANTDKYRQMTGTVYFSRSDDTEFCVSDGNEPGVVMADVPVDLAEVCKVDLDDYGLGKYKLEAPEGSGCDYECTLLQLLLYAADRYAADTSIQLGDTSTPRSLYFTRYWGQNYNFLYYVNGKYPIDYERDPSGATGATADAICLHDGDSVTIAHFSDDSFLADPRQGLRFFLDGEGAMTRGYTATIGEVVAVRLGYLSKSSEPSVGGYAPDEGRTVWWTGDASDLAGAGPAGEGAVTDADGVATLRFTRPGTYWIWAEGVVSHGMAVGSPACARVVIAGDSVKSAAIEEVDAYVDPADYLEAQRAEIDAIVAGAVEAINAAADDGAVAEAVEAAKRALDAVETAAQVQEALAPVVAAISALPAAADLTAADKGAVEAAVALYDALTDAEKAAMGRVDTLKLQLARTLVETMELEEQAAALDAGNAELEAKIAAAEERARKAEAALAQAASPMKATAKAKTLKAKKLKKKAATFEAITVKDAKGKLTYKKVKVDKKKFAKKFAVNKKTGKITVKKGLKKGVYKVTVRVSAAGDKTHEPASVNVVVKVKVK